MGSIESETKAARADRERPLTGGVSWLRAAIVVAIGVVIAPVGDWGHVESGTTSYIWDPSPHVGHSSFWFLPSIAGVIVVAELVRPRLTSVFGEDVSRFRARDAVGAAAGVMLIYAASSLVFDAQLAIATIALTAGALFVWSVVDGTATGFVMGLMVAAIAVTGEIVLVAVDSFRYAPQIDDLIGVAPWLPALHFSFGVAIAVIDRALLASGVGTVER